MIYRSERIQELTDRAKKLDKYIKDLEIGESCYLLALENAISSYRRKLIDRDQLLDVQKDLKMQLEKYYQHTEMFDRHIHICNRYSGVLIEAEKHGCPVCRKLVRIFDGREQ